MKKRRLPRWAIPGCDVLAVQGPRRGTRAYVYLIDSQRIFLQNMDTKSFIQAINLFVDSYEDFKNDWVIINYNLGEADLPVINDAPASGILATLLDSPKF